MFPQSLPWLGKNSQSEPMAQDVAEVVNKSSVRIIHEQFKISIDLFFALFTVALESVCTVLMELSCVRMQAKYHIRSPPGRKAF